MDIFLNLMNLDNVLVLDQMLMYEMFDADQVLILIYNKVLMVVNVY